MALPVIVSRNIKQKLAQNVEADGNPTTIGATSTITIYTVPANKVCLVTNLLFRVTGLGNGTDMQLVAKGRRLRESTATETSMTESAGQGILLRATETLTITGDAAGDNGSAFFVFSGAELPA